MTLKKYDFLIKKNKLLLFHRICQPLFLGGLVTYFSQNQNSVTKEGAYYCAAGIILCSLIPVAAFQPFTMIIVQIGMRIRVACCSLIYKKVTDNNNIIVKIKMFEY